MHLVPLFQPIMGGDKRTQRIYRAQWIKWTSLIAVLTCIDCVFFLLTHITSFRTQLLGALETLLTWFFQERMVWRTVCVSMINGISWWFLLKMMCNEGNSVTTVLPYFSSSNFRIPCRASNFYRPWSPVNPRIMKLWKSQIDLLPLFPAFESSNTDRLFLE